MRCEDGEEGDYAGRDGWGGTGGRWVEISLEKVNILGTLHLEKGVRTVVS